MVLWHGMRISELIELFGRKPDLHLSRWNRIALLPFTAAYNSALALAEQLLYGSRIEKTTLTEPPIFILGFWRSGTTLLHGLLSRDLRHTSPNMYQTLFPWHFLLTERLVSRATAGLLPKSRPMDNVKLSWDAPQEDEIALCVMSGLSPYAFLATPEDFREYWRTLDINNLNPNERARWKTSLLLLMKKITLLTNRRLVMKSPTHTFRISTLLEMFPDARFVYIYRNPYDVFRSAVHLRKVMIAENGLGRPVFKDAEMEIIRSYQACFDAYERDRYLIPQENLHEIRFENLEQEPLEEMAKLYEALDLPGFDELYDVLKPEEPQLKRYRKNVFRDDPRWMARVADELQPAFERYGYPLLPEMSNRADSGVCSVTRSTAGAL